MKNNLITFLALTGLMLCGSHLPAKNKKDYDDPAQFYTLNASLRSEDGRARVVYIPIVEQYFYRPLLQVLTQDGKLLSYDGTEHFISDRQLDTRELHSFKAKDGQMLYLYIQSEKGDDYCSTVDWVSVFRVGKNGKLEQVPVFKTSKAMQKEITCEWHNEEDILTGLWLYSEEDDPYDPYSRGISYDAKTSSLYIPLIEKNKDGSKTYTNRFLVYQFDGNVFVYKGTHAPIWLNTSLKDYKETEYCLMTDGYLVQIDRLKDGSYRYASWKNGDSLGDMKRKPDLVLGNGTVENDCYTFKNKTFIYHVDLNNMTLVVKNNGKTIMKQDFYL